MTLPRPGKAPRRIPLWAWHMLAWIDSGRKGPRPSRAPTRLPAWFYWWRIWRLARTKGKGSWAWTTYLNHLHKQQDAQARLTAVRAAITNWARWGSAHEPSIHYTQGGARDDYLREPKGRLPLWTDCSGFVTYCYWASGTPDPSGLNYQYVGFTGTLLANAQKHGRIYYDVSKAKAGDPIVIGPGTGWHAVIVIEAGADPLVVSHGSESGPRTIRLSVDPRQPKRVCQTLN
jgi:cell wall-associated NlpC family hydrolase